MSGSQSRTCRGRRDAQLLSIAGNPASFHSQDALTSRRLDWTAGLYVEPVNDSWQIDAAFQ